MLPYAFVLFVPNAFVRAPPLPTWPTAALCHAASAAGDESEAPFSIAPPRPSSSDLAPSSCAIIASCASRSWEVAVSSMCMRRRHSSARPSARLPKECRVASAFSKVAARVSDARCSRVISSSQMAI
eukprot:1804410-Pleurochrysis_carterae.AAC.2